MFNNSINRGDKPFLSIGTPRGVALTSLDKYLGETPRKDHISKSPSQMTPADEANETIASLQREQSRLSEELDAERRRSESLKSTFSKSLSQTSSAQKEKLLILKQYLEAEPDNPYAKEALKYVGNISDESNENQQMETPRINELSQRAKEAEKLVERQHKQNQKLKEIAREARDEIAQLRQQLEDINAQIEAAENSRHELKEKTKTIAATAKKRDAAWKERVTQLEAQLLEQG